MPETDDGLMRLLQDLNSEDEETIRHCAALAGRDKRREAVPALCRSLKRGNSEQTNAAVIQALSDIEDPAAVPSLLTVISFWVYPWPENLGCHCYNGICAFMGPDERGQRLSEAVARAILKLQGDQAAQTLLGLLNSTAREEKPKYIYLLGYLQAGEAVATLAGLLDEGDRFVYETIVEALTVIGNEAVIAQLGDLYRNADAAECKRFLLRALIQTRAYGSHASKVLTPERLSGLAEQAEAKGARNALALLMIIEHQCQHHQGGQYAVTSRLEQLIGDGLPLLLGIAALGCRLPRAGLGAEPVFLDVVTREVLALTARRQEILVAAMLQGAFGVELLFQILMQSAAKHGYFYEGKGGQFLLKCKDSADRRVGAQTRGILRSKISTPELIRALKAPEPEVRLSAAQALGRIRNPAALSALTYAAQNDADAAVKAAAFDAAKSAESVS